MGSSMRSRSDDVDELPDTPAQYGARKTLELSPKERPKPWLRGSGL